MRLIFLVLWAVALVEGYKILCVFPVPTPSHNILGKGIVSALLTAGHEVWWATAYPESVKARQNLTVIDVSATRVVFENVNMSDFKNMMHNTLSMGSDIVTLAAESPDLLKAMLGEQFDAVITEWFISDLPAGYAAVQRVPWIMLSSMVAHPFLEHLVDDVTSTALMPVSLNSAPVPMDYWQRVLNSVLVGGMQAFGLLFRAYQSNLYFDIFGPMAAKRGTVLPPLSAVYNNISILFVNSDPVFAHAQSFPPNVVDIGGFHIEEDASLPEDLKQLLDSKNFIYFSLGSVVKISSLPASMKSDLARMFEELPYTVLWKSDEPLTGLPENVHVRSWLPQPGILDLLITNYYKCETHPNIKLFITHGGLLSTVEAVHYGVPMLAVPVFGDQHLNADRAVAAGYARRVDFHAGMAAELKAELQEMIRNDSYYNTVKHLSKLLHGRLVAPSKLISHYVELAIESKGAYHLRSQSRHYYWWQRRRLDQLFGCILFFYGLYTACRIVSRETRRLFKRKKD